MRYRSHQFRADSYGFHSLLEKNVHGIQSLEESFLRRSRTSPITTHNDKNIAATFLLSHTWITIYRHYIRIRRNQSPLNDLTNPRHLLGQRTFWAPANIGCQTACISLYFNDTKTLRHISYDYMQVGTSWEVHWSRPHDLSVNVQDGRRALITARIKVSSFALQNTTSLLAGNLLMLYSHTHRRDAATSVRTAGLYPDNWKKEEQLSVYTVRTLLVLPLSLFGVSLWYHFILCCDRQEIF